MDNLLFLIRAMLFLCTSGMLVSCGGGGGSGAGAPAVQTSELSPIEGTWRSNACEPDGDSLATQEVVINATAFTWSLIAYYQSEDCAGDISVSIHIDGTMSFSGESTGDARHVDINFINGRMTASDKAISTFAAQGTTLQDRVAPSGITDINNIPISLILPSQQPYTIYSVEGDTLRFGKSTPSFTGLEPALRHNSLDTVEYKRVNTSTGMSNELAATGDSEIIGVVYYGGTLSTTIDGFGNLYSYQRGAGTYLILKDYTAVLATSAPADFNLESYRLEEDGKITTLQDLDLEQSDIYPPLAAGYRFDISARNGNASASGPVFRDIVFSRDGTFERSRDTFISGVNSSSGTYSIAGNTIELRYNDGTVERTAFATNGSTVVIVGQQLYAVRENE